MGSEEEIRLKLVLHYDGSGFYGWQVQPDRRTVQGVLQDAVEQLTQTARTVTGSGRTDRGVHATGQVASVVVPGRWSPSGFRKSMNAVLPPDVWIQHSRRVDPGFHPRYDAVARTYRYLVGQAEEARSPFRRPFCWALDEELDRGLLDRTAERLVGERSFESFAKSGQPHRGTRCRIDRADWSGWNDVGLSFTITADRYLHHMVRYLVGTMVDVGRSRRPRSEMAALLEGTGAGLRTSPPAPPHGLYLHRVEYADADASGPGGASEAAGSLPRR